MAYKNSEDLSFLQNLYTQLIDASGGTDAYDARALKHIKGGEAAPAIFESAFTDKPFSTKVDLGKGVTGNSLANTTGMLGGAIKANPYKAAGLGVLGAGNIAGLVDNNKFGGQLVGGLGGGIAAHMLGANPMTTLAVGMGGGMLGSLFDKLRAKKEAEQQIQQDVYQQYGG